MKFEESTKLCDVKYKIVFLGCSGVGKSALIQRFIQQRFDERKAETVAIDFLAKNIHFNGAIYRLQLWDTAGQEKFKSLITSYIRDAHCAVFVYDVASPESFQNIDTWLESFKEFKSEDAVSILVGNKKDLRRQGGVSREEAQAKANIWGSSFCQTSAKSGEGVEELFHGVIENIQVKGQLSASENRINKGKVVRIAGERKKQFPCCYI